MSVHKNKSIKKVVYSLVFGLFSLVSPVYAPNRRPDYIEWMPVVPVADFSMDYQDIEISSITGSGWGGFIEESGQRSIIIDCISAGIVSITWTTSSTVGNFVQRFSLNVAIDDSIDVGDSLGVSGRSNITLFSTERQLSFKCVVYGNATLLGEGEIWLQLSLHGQSSLGPLLSLQMEGILTFPAWDLTMAADGQILSLISRNDDY